MDSLILSLSRQEFPVTLVDKSGEKKDFKICEMSGAERDEWMGKQSRRFRTGPDGRPLPTTDYKNVQASLISYCLYDHTGTKVGEDVIASWPSTTQMALFKKCQEINGLSEEAIEAAKKD